MSQKNHLLLLYVEPMFIEDLLTEQFRVEVCRDKGKATKRHPTIEMVNTMQTEMNAIMAPITF